VRTVITPGSKPAGASAPQPDRGVLARRVEVVLFALGAILSAGFAIEMVSLWGRARLGLPEWEYGALTETIEQLTVPTLGLGFLILAWTLRTWRLPAAKWSARLQRLGFGALLTVVPAVALLTFALLTLAVVSMKGSVPPEMYGPFMARYLKSGGLTALYVIALVPAGLKGLRGRT
jgi:hypothetical protein